MYATYFATAPASGAQTPSLAPRPPPLQQSRAGYQMPASMPASMPRTPYNESVTAQQTPYKPQGEAVRPSYLNDSHIVSSQAPYAQRYSPDQAELRVRNLIADTERMLAGLSTGPSKLDGLTL